MYSSMYMYSPMYIYSSMSMNSSMYIYLSMSMYSSMYIYSSMSINSSMSMYLSIKKTKEDSNFLSVNDAINYPAMNNNDLICIHHGAGWSHDQIHFTPLPSPSSPSTYPNTILNLFPRVYPYKFCFLLSYFRSASALSLSFFFRFASYHPDPSL